MKKELASVILETPLVLKVLYQINQNLLDTMKLNDKNNKIYQMIFYLNPGDYHRFHSPLNMEILKVKNISGKV